MVFTFFTKNYFEIFFYAIFTKNNIEIMENRKIKNENQTMLFDTQQQKVQSLIETIESGV